MIEPARKFRTIRGESANYRTAYYTTKERRDAAAAKRDAERDGEPVLCERWDAESYDDLNRGWGMDWVENPPGYEQPARLMTGPVSRPDEKPIRTAYAVGFAAGCGSGWLWSQGVTVQAADNFIPMWCTTRELQDEWCRGFTTGFWRHKEEQ